MEDPTPEMRGGRSEPTAKLNPDQAPSVKDIHSSRIARLGTCKKRSRDMARYLLEVCESLRPGPVQDDLVKLTYNVTHCSNWLLFHNYYTIDQIKLAGLISCKKHLLCPVCARIRALKSIQTYMDKYKQVITEKPNLKPIFITLTVKNGPDLDERFNHLKTAFTKLSHRRKNARNKSYSDTEFGKIDGAVFSYETTNNGKGWHPHLHMLALADTWLDQSKLAAEWESITGDSYIVDIRRIRGEPIDGFAEVFKYALKFGSLSLEDNFQAYLSFRGKRLQGALGSLWGVQVPEVMTDDLPADLPFEEWFYEYRHGTYTRQDPAGRRSRR